MQQILILNSGSSSLKFQLFLMPNETVLCSGLIERIGNENSKFIYEKEDYKYEIEIPILNHKTALQLVAKQLLDKNTGIIKSSEDIDIVGHRVVHGGKYFSNTTVVTKEVKDKINELSSLAPLHNPANLEGINVAEDIFKEAKQVAVFDTAFHQSIPDYAYKYAIPNEYSNQHNIRLYGFHGTSHKYVSEKAIAYINKPNSKIITIHLGNGCSMTAIKNGKSIDHSLGFSPITGLIMGTRCGDIDPTIIFHLAKNFNLTLEEINTMLLKKSGMLGLTGHSDLRDIQAKADKGDKACQLALAMNTYRIKKYIGSYSAILNGLDAIVFTAGIGENSSYIREAVCNDLDFLGIKIDANKNNELLKTTRAINTKDSKVKILVIPTNEELEIAKQCFNLLKN
ncbi:acetate kinase [Winogradskyella echinorum]|uniref:Acetate kinase n=1 Tax=Winogradskyella echinorum TaxID=538189 RepID=A0ABR6Y5C4_9FLAO|nr:acetate kinase [Winogradskyella echinorum]MBC3847458.1 acetate kinase [Winogradskyella echinorum]MBC5751806.1 acetate kinase [Winogradskyella echinorum]